MSAPVCLRSAFGACRPSRVHHNITLMTQSTTDTEQTTQLPLRSCSITKFRTYADKSDPKIKGIPKTSSKGEQKKMLDQVPGNAAPKRPNPPGMIANSPSAAAANQTSSATPPAVVEGSDTAAEGQVSQRLLPANVIAAYRAPLKHKPPHGVPVASLQLRSFSVRSLEFFADFALRAAYYLNLPASGPVPLPKRIERWTMPRSNFVHKKSQENFERITYKRSITIMDGDKSAVEVWLAVLRKWQFYGVGMKANVWEWEGIDVATKMDAQSKELEKEVEAQLANFGWNKTVAGSRSLDEMLHKQGVKHVGVPMMDVREASRTAKSEI